MAEPRKYYVSFKLKVVNYAEQNTKRKASAVFGVDRKGVREWCKSKRDLETLSKSRKRAPGGGRKVRYEDIDSKLIAWFKERQHVGREQLCR